MPNRANDTIVDSAVPQVKLADRNSARSTSGWPFGRLVTCRSQPTNPASTTAPASMVAMAVRSDHPFCPVLITPYVSAVRPALDSSTPGTSSRSRRSLRDSGIAAATAITAITTTGTLIRNTEPHQKWSSSQPPRMGPTG